MNITRTEHVLQMIGAITLIILGGILAVAALIVASLSWIFHWPAKQLLTLGMRILPDAKPSEPAQVDAAPVTPAAVPAPVVPTDVPPASP